MLINILAAASNAAPATEFGIGPAIQQGGAITVFIIVVLAIMSVGSFYILITKWLEQHRIFSQYKNVRSTFWRANTLSEGATKLEKNSAWRQLVDDALAAEAQHTKMTDSLEAHDWLHGSLARSEASINAKLASGLPFLATVGAAGSGSIDKVAGPVGEALIMTAFGLLVAVPSVFAYNWLQNRNKRISELLAAFATDLLANLTSRGAVKPAIITKTSTQQAARTTAPASAPKA